MCRTIDFGGRTPDPFQIQFVCMPYAPTDSGPERRALVHRESEHKATLRHRVTVNDVVQDSLRRALGGGIAGAGAMAFQVTTLMWIRTTITFQYRYGSTTREAMRTLYAQGGVRRFYQGVAPALVQAPLSRFGDTAANAGVISLLNSNESTAWLPTGVKTLASASAAAGWRVILMPLDTVKSMMQVEGPDGLSKLRAKLRTGGLAVLFHGGGGLVSSAFLGHYLWYGTFNHLDTVVPKQQGLAPTLGRNAAVGFVASAVADTATNSLRVVKTFRQTSLESVTYAEAARLVVQSDGWSGLFGRGLATRLLANGFQAAIFSAMWKYLEQRLARGR